jgi:hypothetical protein
MQKFKIPFFLIGSLIMIYVMFKTGQPLKTPTTNAGILHLEFASNKVKVDSILQAWAPDPQTGFNKIEAAKTNTYWDFLFLFFYAGFLFFVCRFFANIYKEGSGFANAGLRLAKWALLAGALDMVENICMLQSLSGNGSNALAMITVIASSIKWCLVFVCVMYILLSAPLYFYFQKVR